MTEFFIPKSGPITVGGKTQRLIRGLHDVPDTIADSREAIDFGIKTVDEMTDAEWVSIGRKKPESAKDGAKTPTLDGAVRKVSTAD